MAKKNKVSEEARDSVRLSIASGWEVINEDDVCFYLKKPQSAMVHILLAAFFWWLAFIPNLVYMASKGKVKKIMKQ